MAPRAEARVNEAVRLEGRWEEAYEGSKAPVVGGAGSRAALRFNGTSVSLWGSAHAKSGSSKQSKVSYRCTVDGTQRRTTTHLTTPRQTPSELCHSSNLAPGEHILEFEVDDAVHAEVILESFTIQEDSQSLVPRDLVVVPISIIEVVVMGEDVRTINGTPTTVGWKVVGTNTVTETGTPFVVSDTNTGTSTSSEATPTTEPPPPPPPPPTTSQETTPPPPPPTTTSQSSAPTTAPSSSSRVTSISRVQSTPSQSTPSIASISFITYSTSSLPEQSGLPETTAGSATAGESRSLAPGAIVGIALGALTIIAAAAIIGWIIYLRQKRYQQTPRPLALPSSGTASPYDTPHAFPADRKLPIVDTVAGTPSSGNSMSAGTQGLSYTNGSVPLPLDQAYAPVTASPPAPLSAHPFLQEDPMARSDDGHSTASPPTYYDRPPTYHERQSTISRPGYF